MKNFNTIGKVILVGAFALATVSCKDDFTTPPGLTGTPLATIMAADANFNMWTAVVTKTGQYNQLNNNNSGLVTAFAPSDAAFITYLTAAYPAFFGPLTPPVTEDNVVAFLAQLNSTSTPTLVAFINTTVPIINYHLISSKLTASLITGNQVFSTLNSARLSISKTGTTVVLNANNSANGANVTAFDLLASNGVAHTIDRVMTAVGTATVLTSFPLTISYATNPPTVTGGTGPYDATDTDFDLFSSLIRYTGQTPIILPNTVPLPDFTVFRVNDGLVRAYMLAINGTLTTEGLCGAYIATLTDASGTSPSLAELRALVQYHVVPGRFLTTDFINGQVVSTLLTSQFTMGISPVPPAAGPYTYTLTDVNTGVTDPIITTPAEILTNSGILHTINGVLRSN